MIVNSGRTIVRRLAWSGPPSSTDRVARLSHNPLRVLINSHIGYTLPTGQTWSFNGSIISQGRRSLATKPASRPKAHTGRTTSKPRKKATTTTKTTAETASKTPSAAKEKAKAKPKAKPKTKPKARTTAKAKPKTRAKSKAKPKVRVKKPRTAEQVAKANAKKERARITELKKKALTVPKALPRTAYSVVHTEVARANHGLAPKEAAAKYKALTPEELEVTSHSSNKSSNTDGLVPQHYNHIANTNAAANKAAYDKWILSHTPDEILIANNARKILKRLVKKQKAYAPLHDDRLVRRPLASFMRFHAERINSGDYKHMGFKERAPLIGKEWRELGASEKKVNFPSQRRPRWTSPR